ncbi:MAG: DegT/DnrJ/EryC1/StrS aminotransferase family protein [Marinilabiliales bacterium]|nr:DegT/DnrJ/EryC1/StrS aminotransferase family protein [Marinilabiliales bacterium]
MYPVYQPSLRGNELKYVNDCLTSGWISSKGKYNSAFEEAFAAYLGVAHATTVCNGTVALHLALLALGIGPGDQVIVPTFTYIASVNAIQYTGATPVFVDSLADTWQMDPQDVQNKCSKATKAILVPHIYGHPCDMKSLQQICRERKLFLIEDCAEAIGSRYEGSLMGTFGDISAFSFFGNKTITTGEGGMVTCHDPQLIEKVKKLKNQGLSDKEYWHDTVGYNYRMTNICAAIGLAQLENIDRFIADKRFVAETYQSAFAGSPLVIHPESPNCFHSYWLVSLLLPQKDLRGDLRKFLKAEGIETRPLFYPVHTMPIYDHLTTESFPVATDIAGRGINLPSYPDLSREDILHIAKLTLQFTKDHE